MVVVIAFGFLEESERESSQPTKVRTRFGEGLKTPPLTADASANCRRYLLVWPDNATHISFTLCHTHLNHALPHTSQSRLPADTYSIIHTYVATATWHSQEEGRKDRTILDLRLLSILVDHKSNSQQLSFVTVVYLLHPSPPVISHYRL